MPAPTENKTPAPAKKGLSPLIVIGGIAGVALLIFFLMKNKTAPTTK